MLLVHCVCAFWKRGWQLSMHSFYPRGGLSVSSTHLSWINIHVWCFLCLEGISFCRCIVIVSIKQYHYDPGQALRVPGCWDSLLSRQSAHEGGKVGSPMHRPPLPPQANIPGTHFFSRLSQTQGHSAAGRIIGMKNSSDTMEIETATFRLVAQYLNQLCHLIPFLLLYYPDNRKCSSSETAEDLYQY